MTPKLRRKDLNLARRARAFLRTLRNAAPDALEELQDSWAIAVAEVAGGIAYLLGRSEIEALAVGAAVLATRVAAGLLIRPKKTRPGRPRARPPRDREIFEHLKSGMTVAEVARTMTVTERYVRRVQREMELETQDETPRPAPVAGASRPQHWYEHPLIRGTATAATFLGLAKLIRDELAKAGVI